MPEITSIPTTPYWEAPATQTTQAATTATTNTAPAQQVTQPQMSFDTGDMVDLAKTGYKFVQNSGLFGTPLGSFTSGGIATGATTAAGGTFTTGAGLAGEASAINTTAGAAGNATSGLSSGLATAGVGLVSGFLGDKVFGGYGGAGSSVATTAAMAAGLGPVGIVAAGLFGGAVGGLFGGKETSMYVIDQGTNINRYNGGVLFDTALGQVRLSGKNSGTQLYEPSKQVFIQSDDAVASILSDDQLKRAKQGIANGNIHNWTKWKSDGAGAKTVLEEALKDRYAAAMSGLGSYWGGAFQRIATKDNMGGLISTIARIDEDVRSQQGIFSGMKMRDAKQVLNRIAGVYKLPKRPLNPYKDPRETDGDLPPETTIINALTGQPYEAKTNWLGIDTSGNQAFKREVRSDFGKSVDDYQQKTLDWEKNVLGAWETKVLEAYVANNAQNNQINIARESQPAETQATGGLLSQASVAQTITQPQTPTWTGGVRRHGMLSKASEFTDANKLRDR